MCRREQGTFASEEICPVHHATSLSNNLGSRQRNCCTALLRCCVSVSAGHFGVGLPPATTPDPSAGRMNEKAVCSHSHSRKPPLPSPPAGAGRTTNGDAISMSKTYDDRTTDRRPTHETAREGDRQTDRGERGRPMMRELSSSSPAHQSRRSQGGAKTTKKLS